jgi:hypothetical protein
MGKVEPFIFKCYFLSAVKLLEMVEQGCKLRDS